MVLFVSLALLLALTIGGLAATLTTTLELRMARNDHDAAFAFHAAQAALADAENWLRNNPADPATMFSANGRSGLHTATPYREVEPWRRARWTDADSREVATEVPGVAAQPRYIVEWLATWADTGTATAPLPPATGDVFRITARGTGASGQTTVMLQSIYSQARRGGSRPKSERWAFIELRG